MLEPDREETIFASLLALSSPQREAYLDEVCTGNDELRRRLTELLEAHESDETFMQSPPAVDWRSAGSLILPLSEKPGDRIGRYKLMEQIGEGGCGVVYVAEQTEPVRRRVALKIVKLGMDTKQVVARFEAERQALALMDHPNIAKIYDAGVTGAPVATGGEPSGKRIVAPGGNIVDSAEAVDRSSASPGGRMLPSMAAPNAFGAAATLSAGRPYFVMELVRGIKITDYCDQNHLTTAERLNLFIQVCQAVQHAHQKGIIHRDLKPSNILVTENDGVPVPKVIDFGIAKATQGRLTDRTIYTAFEQFIGTPAYMSPEQAVMTSLDVDTRSDIYSLGVLLYELLTGRTPFETDALLEAGLDAMRQTIREQEPPKPSTRLSTMLVTDLAAVAQHRRAEPPKLLHAVRGDLDWIVMKCLEKDRTRRYETANGLAADIQRHLQCEPVIARPPSKIYEFQKTVRRHKFGFIGATVLIITLAVGAVVSTNQAIRAIKAERQQARLREQAEQAGKSARENEEEARRQQGIASEQETLARHQFYDAEMNLAMQAWEAGQPAAVLEILESQRPHPPSSDLRGFEWYHLWNLCNSQLMKNLRGHRAVVLTVAFSPDGKLLASSSGDGTIRLWDVTSGAVVMTMAQGTAPNVGGALFTPDGNTIASWRWDNLVRLWDVATGRCIARLSGHQDRVHAVAISPDGETLASGDSSGMVRIWDLKTRAEKTNLFFTNAVSSLAFDPDGALYVSGSIGLCLERDGRLHPSPIKPTGGDSRLAFSPYGKVAASINWGRIGLWNTGTAEHLRDLDSGAWGSVAFLPNGKSIISSSHDRAIQLWPIAGKSGSNATPQIIGQHLNAVMCLAVSPDGKIAASGDADGLIKLWDLTKTKESASRAAASFRVANGSWDQTMEFLFTAAGSRTFVVDTSEGAEVRDLSTGKLLNLIRGAVGSGALSPDGNLLATSLRDGTVKLWELGTATLLATTQASPPSTWRSPSLAFSADGKVLASGNDAYLRLWDVSSGLKLLKTLPPMIGAGNGLVQYSPDGKKLAAVVRHGSVWLLDGKSGRLERVIALGSGTIEITAMVFSPDSRWLATARETGEVKLWDVQTGLSHLELKGHFNAVRAIAFAPDGSTLATGGDDRSVRLWDTLTGQERVAIKRHKGRVSAIAFSDDGGVLLTGDRDGVVWITRGTRNVLADDAPLPLTETSPLGQDDSTTAWVQATYPDAVYRDGAHAVEFAERAAKVTQWGDADVLSTLAAAYAESGQFSNAVRVQRMAISALTNEAWKASFLVQLKAHEMNLPYRDHGYWEEWARNLQAEGDYARGETVARECLALRERMMPDDWRTFYTRGILGGCLLGQKRHSEAEPLLVSACEGLLQRRNSMSPEARVSRGRQTFQRLAQLYEESKRPDDSAKWKQKLAEFESTQSYRETTAPARPPAK